MMNDVGIKDVVPYKRDDDTITKVKRPIEPSDVGKDFMREYDRMLFVEARTSMLS